MKAESEVKLAMKLVSELNVETNKESEAKPSKSISSLSPSSIPIVKVDWFKSEPLMFWSSVPTESREVKKTLSVVNVVINVLSEVKLVMKALSEDKIVVNKLSEAKVVTNAESVAKPTKSTSSLVPSSIPIVNVDWLKTEPLMFWSSLPAKVSKELTKLVSAIIVLIKVLSEIKIEVNKLSVAMDVKKVESEDKLL